MMIVKLEAFKDLTNVEKEEAPNNGSGKEYASYLRVMLNEKTVALYSDAMEGEDAVFFRDLDWIKPAIEKAYEAGIAATKRGGE